MAFITGLFFRIAGLVALFGTVNYVTVLSNSETYENVGFNGPNIAIALFMTCMTAIYLIPPISRRFFSKNTGPVSGFFYGVFALFSIIIVFVLTSVSIGIRDEVVGEEIRYLMANMGVLLGILTGFFISASGILKWGKRRNAPKTKKTKGAGEPQNDISAGSLRDLRKSRI